MSELQIFKNAEFGSVRTVTVEGEPHFVAKDVAEILGYSNPRDAINKHVDEEDKGVRMKVILFMTGMAMWCMHHQRHPSQSRKR